jgi:ABC-type microcin C transport system duplicated ATPase subunit YejF
VSGAIRFRGRDLLALSEPDMRKVRGNEISMIFQEPMTSLNPVLTVGSQIAEALVLHRGLARSDAMARAVGNAAPGEYLRARARASEYPHQMSGGMRQRVMIAMALGVRSEAAHRRRADHRARRHDPGADPRPHARA